MNMHASPQRLQKSGPVRALSDTLALQPLPCALFLTRYPLSISASAGVPEALTNGLRVIGRRSGPTKTCCRAHPG